jgi:hypothetical protein
LVRFILQNSWFWFGSGVNRFGFTQLKPWVSPGWADQFAALQLPISVATCAVRAAAEAAFAEWPWLVRMEAVLLEGDNDLREAGDELPEAGHRLLFAVKRALTSSLLCFDP